ncbi:hypothetical protein ABPG77_006954 [Micractinium sp. CCAP 211/92]
MQHHRHKYEQSRSALEQQRQAYEQQQRAYEQQRQAYERQRQAYEQQRRVQEQRRREFERRIHEQQRRAYEQQQARAAWRASLPKCNVCGQPTQVCWVRLLPCLSHCWCLAAPGFRTPSENSNRCSSTNTTAHPATRLVATPSLETGLARNTSGTAPRSAFPAGGSLSAGRPGSWMGAASAPSAATAWCAPGRKWSRCTKMSKGAGRASRQGMHEQATNKGAWHGLPREPADSGTLNLKNVAGHCSLVDWAPMRPAGFSTPMALASPSGRLFTWWTVQQCGREAQGEGRTGGAPRWAKEQQGDGSSRIRFKTSATCSTYGVVPTTPYAWCSRLCKSGPIL